MYRAEPCLLHFFWNGYFRVDEFEEAGKMMFPVVLQCAEDGWVVA
jgi:hypothetical protein